MYKFWLIKKNQNRLVHKHITCKKTIIPKEKITSDIQKETNYFRKSMEVKLY